MARGGIGLTAVLIAWMSVFSPQDQEVGYTDTPYLPGHKWRVHDAKRPAPPVVDPTGGPKGIPADAIPLFQGGDLSRWRSADGKPAAWKLEGDFMEVNGTGSILTRQDLGDGQLHIEWCAPEVPKGASQHRGNSGVFLMSRYEVQILDSYRNRSYADGQAAAMYGQYPPLVNACRPPGEWQTYDIVFRAPRFDENGRLAEPARVTVFHNGLCVHDDRAFIGQTAHRAVARYHAHDSKAPLMLQDHGNPVRFRNIWFRPM